MTVNVMRTYEQLMTALGTLPDEIAACQADLDEAKAQLETVQAAAAAWEAQALAELGGWSALGKNEGERKAAWDLALRQDATHRDYVAEVGAQQREVTALAAELDHLTRQYGSVCYQARLHAAMVGYLANAGAPTEPGPAQKRVPVRPMPNTVDGP